MSSGTGGYTCPPQEDPSLSCVKIKTLLEESLLSWDSGMDALSIHESARTVFTYVHFSKERAVYFHESIEMSPICLIKL